MIISNKYIFIRYSIRNKTQPLLIITLEFPSTLARLANILWLRAKLCITLVSLPPKKIITKPKTKVLFIATANDLKTVSRWILWNIIDNSLQGKPFEPNWCFFQGLWGIEWRSYLSLVTVWRTNSLSPRGLRKQLFLFQISCPRHLLPRQRKQHGLAEEDVDVEEEVLKEVVQGYTQEAGVR